MKGRYLDIGNINHLIEQRNGGGVFDNKLWRESYYFNMTDPRNGISLITTIGQLPNRKRSAGFLLLIEGGKPTLLKPLVSFKVPVFTDHRIKLGRMTYSIQGIDWLLKYGDNGTSMDLRFSPINRLYAYRKEQDDEWEFVSIASQHYEQFGEYSGTIVLRGKKFDIQGALGHRDHSWGVRDWGSIDRYSLHCCAFSSKFAFNLWEGVIGGKRFYKGFFFDGENNLDIIERSVRTEFRPDGREPLRSTIRIKDSNHRTHEILSESLVSVPFPPPGALVHEGIARMTGGDLVGYGLQEYLWHYPNTMRRIPIWFRLLKMKGVLG